MGNPGDLQVLRELNEGYIAVVQASDAPWFERHLADDFVNGNPDCTLEERSAFIERIARPSPVSGLRCEDVRIQLLGNVAIIRARTVYAKADGATGAGRYTDVWARRGESWQCVCADVTRFEPAMKNGTRPEGAGCLKTAWPACAGTVLSGRGRDGTG